MTYKRDLLEIKFLDDGCQVVGIAIHIVSAPGLAGPAVSTAIVRDHAKTIPRKEQQLPVPRIGIQRPSVGKSYGRPFSPVFVVDGRPILHADCAHVFLLLIGLQSDAL
jgi:hypothetical protein